MAKANPSRPPRGDLPEDLTEIRADRLYSSRQAAHLLAVSIATLEVWRRERRGPHFMRVAPTMVRYSGRALLDWVAVQGAKAGAYPPPDTPGGRAESNPFAA